MPRTFPLVLLASIASASSASSSSSSSPPSAPSAPAAPPTLNVTLLLHLHNSRTWFGGSAVALQSPSDPVFMTSTWVYSPVALFGDRPLASPSPLSWESSTTQDMRFQTLDVASAAASGTGQPAHFLARDGASSSPSPSTFVDSLALWLEKPDGIAGTCVLVGFNSAYPPKPDANTTHFPTGTVWRTTLGESGNCVNVNGWSPWTSFALSQDGQVAAGWVLQQDGSYLLQALNGQTGEVLWTTVHAPPPPPEDQEFFSYGIGLSADGRFAVIDAGVAGLGDHHLYVHDVQSPNGTLRDVVPSAVAAQGALSRDGAYIFTVPSSTAPVVDLWVWDGAKGAYDDIGTSAPAPIPSSGQQETSWDLVAATFGYDAASNRSVFAAVWVASSLSGNGVAAVWDVQTFATGRAPLAAYTFSAVPGSDIAIDGGAVACDGTLCVVGLETPKVNGTSPTVVLFDLSVPAEDGETSEGAPRPPVWNFTSPGSINSVALSLGASADGKEKVAYVLASGCDSFGICVKPGADAYMWEVRGW
jgi:hypothetical protein